MRFHTAHGLSLACAALVYLPVLPAMAQVASATKAEVTQTAAAAAVAPTADASAAPRRAAEPNVQRIVSEDDNVRIDELRVRGQTTQIVVQSKTAGGSRYEILPGEAGRDPSLQDKRGAGQRVWRLFSF